MSKIAKLIQTDDWKNEKHVPVIECASSVKKGEKLGIRVCIGKEITHPNTTEHHIRWIRLFYQPADEKICYQLASCEFTAHGESTQGADKGPAYTDHSVTQTVMLNKTGTLFAISYCNIHGLWENSQEIKIE